MPNRMIKDSIHTSETVNAMTDFQFRLWISLITYVDDYGRGDARAAVIRGSCFPLRERLTIKDIEAGLAGLAGIGCVVLYEVDGRPYLCFPSWEKHQSIRNKRSKFPAPPDDLQAIAINCNQLHANVPVIQYNPIQTETETEYEPRKCAQDATAFERFWDAYPKKQGKKAAESAFAKAIKKITLDCMLAALEKHKVSDQWTRDVGKYIPYAATWLNGERWNDELQPAASTRDRKFAGFMHDGDSFSEMMKRDVQKLIREYGNGEADGT